MKKLKKFSKSWDKANDLVAGRKTILPELLDILMDLADFTIMSEDIKK